MYVNFAVKQEVTIIMGFGLSCLLCYSALGRGYRVTDF